VETKVDIASRYFLFAISATIFFVGVAYVSLTFRAPADAVTLHAKIAEKASAPSR
jgi:hypothetical protein